MSTLLRTATIDPGGPACAECDRLIRERHPEAGLAADAAAITEAQCVAALRAGAIAYPEFGWCCDAACAEAYEHRTHLRRARDAYQHLL